MDYSIFFAGGCGVCGAVDASRPLWHVDTFRIRGPEKIIELGSQVKARPQVPPQWEA